MSGLVQAFNAKALHPSPAQFNRTIGCGYVGSQWRSNVYCRVRHLGRTKSTVLQRPMKRFCVPFALANRIDPLTEFVAKKVLEIAQAGELDTARIKALALQDFENPSVVSFDKGVV